jgi:pimeloyl-ACP methyl ester carboxylesterase
MTKKPHQGARHSPASTQKLDLQERERKALPKRWLFAGAAAAAIVGTAIVNQVEARRAEAATPPLGKFVEVDGVRLHYVDEGQGPAVVLLHGNAVMLQDFVVSGVLALAAEQHRVIAFDRPGFGYSERPRSTIWTPEAQADILAKALRQMGVKKAVVVGHSWGTMVALAMALNHSNVVAGLVLLSGYYYGTARPDVLPASIPAIPLLGDLLAYTVVPLTGLMSGPVGIKASFAPAPVPDKIAALPKAMALRPSQVRATAADTALMVPSAVALSKRYGEIAMPVIIMAGAGDVIVHVDEHAERLVHDIAGAKLQVVPAQGHMLHYAVPEAVVAAIDEVQARIGKSIGA